MILPAVGWQQLAAGGVMVWLGGPRRGGGRTKPLILNDPPPGYRPPRAPSWHLLLTEGHARVLVRVATVILVLVVAATAVIMALMIATYH
jgi:hypothetical protein